MRIQWVKVIPKEKIIITLKEKHKRFFIIQKVATKEIVDEVFENC